MMSFTGIQAFDSTLQKTNEWLNAIDVKLELNDKHLAYSVLRVVLHALRDRLTPEEAVQLGAQLPMLIRGFYYEGWSLKNGPGREFHLEDFMRLVRQSFELDFRILPARALRAVFQVLAERIDSGEIEDILQSLPKDLREFWTTELAY